WEQHGAPERLDQLGAALLLGAEAADQPDVARRVAGKAAVDSRPQLGARVADVGDLHPRQLAVDHGGHERGLVAEAAVDRGLADARDARHRLHAHPREPALPEERERRLRDGPVDGGIEGPGHANNITLPLRNVNWTGA